MKKIIITTFFCIILSILNSLTAGPEFLWTFKNTGMLPTGGVGGGSMLKESGGMLVYTAAAPHCYFTIRTSGQPLNTSIYHMLTFRFISPVAGKITLFYRTPDAALVSMDTAIETIAGDHEYRIDLETMTYGKDYKNQAAVADDYQRFGGRRRQIDGLRVDTWFPVGTEIRFAYMKLSEQ